MRRFFSSLFGTGGARPYPALLAASPSPRRPAIRRLARSESIVALFAPWPHHTEVFWCCAQILRSRSPQQQAVAAAVVAVTVAGADVTDDATKAMATTLRRSSSSSNGRTLALLARSSLMRRV